MAKEKKAKEIMIQGVNVASLNEANLKELFQKMDNQLKDLKDNELMERLETDMVKKALQSTAERLKKIEVENMLLKQDLMEQKSKGGRIKGTSFQERKKPPGGCFKLIVNNRMIDPEKETETETVEVKTPPEISVVPSKLIAPEESVEEQVSESEAEESVESENEINEELYSTNQTTMEDIIEEEETPKTTSSEKPPVLLNRRDRLKEMGVQLKSIGIVVDPNDPSFYKSVKEEKINEVTQLKQEIKLYEYELAMACQEIEKVFKSRLLYFNRIWSDEIKSKLLRRIKKAEAKRDQTNNMIQENVRWMENKRERDRKKLRAKLINLDQTRTKMIEDRYKRKEEYIKDKFHMEKMMVTESYDTVIKQLKENHNIVYVNTQQFFRDTAENDILLIISLKNELKTLQANMDKMDEEIARMKNGIKKIKGPLEESEKETRWMETFVAAIAKDTKSMACHEKYNEELQKTIDEIQNECVALEEDIKLKDKTYEATIKLKDNVAEWSARYKDSNAFVKLMKDAYKFDAKKIERMENTLISKGLILPKHIPLIRNLVHKKVEAAKKIQFARQKEVKAFNELIHQLEIRSANLLVDSWPKIYRMGGVPYRKTPANLLATYDSSQKFKKRQSNQFGDFMSVKKI
ncbi:centromere-associated protein E-like isoform X2 [Cimex lectularius]|uniref:Growth arrest-specific protein 8 domain-containing protein n=1 Tax=Cimex lectularius TaxID=79782 RepID=A0A8I6S7W5_CIMLE|nr:centromere-associated protein E-like isoform X2 [Cimex lectularius]